MCVRQEDSENTVYAAQFKISKYPREAKQTKFGMKMLRTLYFAIIYDLYHNDIGNRLEPYVSDNQKFI